MGKLVGIDLGTTNTVVAIMDGPRARVLDSRESKTHSRSAVGVRRRRGKRDERAEELLVGDAAIDNWSVAPEDTIVSVKRLMGRGVTDPEVRKVSEWAQFKVVEPSNGTRDGIRVLLAGKEHSPIDISAFILRKAKEDAEFRLGEPVTHAVITVPAYFSQIQRDATRKAGLKAGLKVLKLLDEPTAAAIAFGTDASNDDPKTVLVYDLGGGTFDVSLLMVAGGIFAPLRLAGDMWLGGDNIDQLLVDHALARIKEDFDIEAASNRRFMVELRKAAQTVKERLTSSRSTSLVVSSILKDEDDNLVDIDIEITREQFERMILPLVATYRECPEPCKQANFVEGDRCVSCGKQLRFCRDASCSCGRCVPVQDGRTIAIVRRALRDKNLDVGQIDCVLMAGNSTIIPLVQNAIEDMFGRDKVVRTVHPKHSVALGAAIQAAWIGERVVCPNDKCDQVNEPEATRCAKCNTPLQLEDDDKARSTIVFEVPAGPEPTATASTAGRVGSIAAMNYGAQVIGDGFSVFVRKDDTYPTPSEDRKPRTFYIPRPNARMISIPIYGGENLDKASANALQGQAFAVLPPGLPKDTPVRLTIWLDASGIFEVSAYLESGVDLQPWVVTAGESDARAIECIERVERVIAAKADLPQDTARELEDRRNGVLAKMKDRDFDGALREVEALETDTASAGKRGGAALRERAESASDFVEFVAQQYAFMFEPAQLHQINRVVGEVRVQLEKSDDAQLTRKLDDLEAIIESFPGGVKMLLTVKSMIVQRIQPVDPAAAAALMSEIDAFEELLQRDDAIAEARFPALMLKVQRALTEIGQQAAKSSFPCWKCAHACPISERHCPKCHADQWIVGDKRSGT